MDLFPKNEHKVERVVRVIAGAAIVSLIFWGPETWWGLLGFIPLVTGAIGSCPIYTALGIQTCPKTEEPTHA